MIRLNLRRRRCAACGNPAGGKWGRLRPYRLSRLWPSGFRYARLPHYELLWLHARHGSLRRST